MFLNISQNSWENICATASFLIKFIEKETLAQIFSCAFCEIFKSTFFTEHLRGTASVCVFVCVCVCVCVCVYTLLPWRLLPSARCLRHTWGVWISDVMFWVSFQVLLPSFSISASENVIFLLQRRNSKDETICYIWLAKRWYVLILDISRPRLKADEWRKDTKDKEATLI